MSKELIQQFRNAEKEFDFVVRTMCNVAIGLVAIVAIVTFGFVSAIPLGEDLNIWLFTLHITSSVALGVGIVFFLMQVGFINDFVKEIAEEAATTGVMMAAPEQAYKFYMDQSELVIYNRKIWFLKIFVALFAVTMFSPLTMLCIAGSGLFYLILISGKWTGLIFGIVILATFYFIGLAAFDVVGYQIQNISLNYESKSVYFKIAFWLTVFIIVIGLAMPHVLVIFGGVAGSVTIGLMFLMPKSDEINNFFIAKVLIYLIVFVVLRVLLSANKYYSLYQVWNKDENTEEKKGILDGALFGSILHVQLIKAAHKAQDTAEAYGFGQNFDPAGEEERTPGNVSEGQKADSRGMLAAQEAKQAARLSRAQATEGE